MTSAIVKIDIYSLCKPLRNRIGKLNLQALLELIHEVLRGQDNSVEIKLQGIGGSTPVVVFRWELHLLAREALLQASLGGDRKQPCLQDLIKLINDIRCISDGISQKTINSGTSALRALHPLIHQQARWQHTRDWDRFYRAFRIYNQNDIRELLFKALRVRLTTIFALTLAIAGSAQRSPRILSTNDYTFMDISAEERDAYFVMVGCSHEDLLNLIKKSAKYDESWAYTWNPLEATPLIQLRPNRPCEYLCPFPEFLLRRVTDGLFFDLIKHEKSFSNPYGKAFQRYVGDVLRAQFKEPAFRVLEEREYWVGQNKKHGVDWIVSDTTGHLMFECKTRRIPVGVKAVVDGDQLAKAIEGLAEAVVQHYKNVDDALKGNTQWMPDNKPVYVFVVTLDDWYLSAPHVVEMLQNQVREQLENDELTPLLESLPFIVTSIAEFEQMGQAIAQIGINRFCSGYVLRPARHFWPGIQISQDFPDIKVKYQRLFTSGGMEMFGHLAHLMNLPGISG